MVLARLALLIFLACSPDRPAPNAPAGKATDFSGLFDLFEQMQPQSESDTTASATPERIDANSVGFNIDLVFLHSLGHQQKDWIQQIATQWEPFFQDQPQEVETATQDTIDDLRIYVDTKTLDSLTTISDRNLDPITVGKTEVLQFREDANTPLTAIVYINQRQVDLFISEGGKQAHPFWKEIFHHELGHAFGIGVSPAWKEQIVWRQNPVNPGSANQVAYYTGANALREYQERNVRGHPRYVRTDGIYLGATDFGVKKTPIHFSMISGMHFNLFLAYYLTDQDRPNICRVALGTFDDIGWTVNYELGMDKYHEGFHITPCWMSEPGNFHLCE